MAAAQQIDIHTQYPSATRVEDGFAFDIKGNKLGPVNDGEYTPPSGVTFDFGFGKEQPLPEKPSQPQEYTPPSDVTFDFGFGKTTSLGPGQTTPSDPSLISKAVNVLRKTVMGPDTALATPLAPAQQQEVSAATDLLHGHFGSAFQKLSDTETPHVIQGSPLERLIKTFKPDFQGSVTKEQEQQFDAQYNPGRKPLVDVAQFIDKNESPTLKAVAETAQSFTSPETVTITIGIGGLGCV